MKSAVSALRNLVLPSVGFELKSRTAYLAELTRRARFWQWELAAFPHRDGTGPDVLYLGRKMERAQAMALLGIDGDIAAQPGRRAASRSVVVSEMWVPGALRVPALLSMVVPLGRALDEIAAGYDAGLRKLIRRRQADYRIRRVDEADIDRVERDMLKPFAAARHGARALRLDPGDVRKIALADWGRFDLVYAGEEAVGCQLSYRFVRAGKRYWRLFYCGYPQAIFADGRRLRETNSMNNYLALKWAIENGYDYLDLGLSLARPDGGLLRWKRERKGVLDTMGNHDYLYVRLPRSGVAQFLWDAPLFSVKRGRLALHLGIPGGTTDDEVVARYREMGFSGLAKVYLHCERKPGERLLAALSALYAAQEHPPAVEAIAGPPEDA